MTGREAPTLTVVFDGDERKFAPGHDIHIGRDIHADVRITHPLVSRIHLIIRFVDGKWIAEDQRSLNGIFVNGRQVGWVEVRDDTVINLGDPGGPRMTFALGGLGSETQLGIAPPTMRGPASGLQPASYTGTQQHYPTGDYPSGPQTYGQPGPQTYGQQHPYGAPPSAPQTYGTSGPTRPRQQYPSAPTPIPAEHSGEPVEPFGTRAMRALGIGGGAPKPSPGAVTVGRAPDNTIVVNDVLASRHHALLLPTAGGLEIQDLHTINGTFVNGVQVEQATVREGDTVTIGNVDLVVQNGTLVKPTMATRVGGLEVQGIDFTVEGGKKLLDNISFSAGPGSLTAVIGPSGAGKSTLARLIVGNTQPSAGKVSFEGHGVHAEYAVMRNRIGMVPQDDVVHPQLTVSQALHYAAELRLPPDTSKEDREQVVSRVLEELEMTKHAETRVDKLSGGQRKRASVAMELLTGPSLLILDEPTSGLDPALDRQVMSLMRQLADAGRVVVVVTHSLTYLSYCDQVLLLAPGGKTAYCGPPRTINQEMGTTDWADIFANAAADPDGVHQAYLTRHPAANKPVTAPVTPGDLGKPPKTSLLRQVSTVARRQGRLILADRGYFIFLALLPFVLAGLVLSVPGSAGFNVALPDNPNEPGLLLALTNLGASFLGLALTIRDLIGERVIFRREQAVGLSATAYLLAKIITYCGAAIVQSAIMTAVIVIVRGGPTQGAVLLGNANFELWVAIAATACAATVLGLVLSSLATSAEQVMPMLVIATMTQIVFSGGLIPVTGRAGLEQFSFLFPSRWGFAATAVTTDLRKLVPVGPQDELWNHNASTWLFDMGILTLLALVMAGFVRWRIRLKG
ncbi:ATP-binding cassette domain-containing protein [Mycobacteroides salmoniphilum]|uniref:ABC transporter ATP-binding/permease protein n=1 Tax=Mycobacteroides salmoniphilum TaxID=404941 RepID=A0A4R8SXY0_9MYCO|nr:ATP-binding cassette domain-containing protein [Mycobacteroides salmoniphilum]TDZ92375.1 ABC transporter ATP-binding/permease protein [Mycobacteroides salmoniphilum]TEA08200.1 ABC transporter ATP-binding/permease protein [Mycobacteroides salmoniphilum]